MESFVGIHEAPSAVRIDRVSVRVLRTVNGTSHVLHHDVASSDFIWATQVDCLPCHISERLTFVMVRAVLDPEVRQKHSWVGHQDIQWVLSAWSSGDQYKQLCALVLVKTSRMRKEAQGPRPQALVIPDSLTCETAKTFESTCLDVRGPEISCVASENF